MLQRDPLEDFLSSLLADAVDLGVRDVVRETIIDMADQYMKDETANTVYNELFSEELRRVLPGVVCRVCVCVCVCVCSCMHIYSVCVCVYGRIHCLCVCVCNHKCMCAGKFV